jgi:hypothetical protein
LIFRVLAPVTNVQSDAQADFCSNANRWRDGAPINRPEDNLVLDNTIEGSPPDGLDDLWMVGILVFAADHTTILTNDLRPRDYPAADAVGQGIVLGNSCCGDGVSYLRARGTRSWPAGR